MVSYALNLLSGLELEEPREASDMEKRRAATAVSNILSVLTHYSELTGRLVCGKRCCLSGMGLLGSSITSSIGRIKQSFVLWVWSNSYVSYFTCKHSSAFCKILIYMICCFAMEFVLPCRTDPHLPGMPIVYASDAFLKLTGAHYQTSYILTALCGKFLFLNWKI